jgi:bifunctional non-homologous end joining protein LigD
VPATTLRAPRRGLHEIKHDGYRLIVQREGKAVRLFTCNGHDWTERYPLIIEAALRIRSKSSVIATPKWVVRAGRKLTQLF